LAVTDRDARAGERAIAEYRERADAALDGLDLLVVPTVPFVAPPAHVDETAIRDDAIRFTYPFDALGWPSLALPCGSGEHGLPASVQVVGRSGDDALVLAAGIVLSSPVRGTAAA